MLTDENYSQPVQVKIDTTGIYKMMDVPLFKDYLQRNLSSENFRSQEYVNVLNDDNLVDVINLNNKVSYSTLVNKQNRVYQVLIYTKKEEKEQMLIAELTSDVEIQDFKLNKFTGTIIFKDLNLNVLGNEMFENGHSIKSYSKSICGYVTTAVSCASGRHFPGEACAYSGTSGSAYYDTEILNCSGGHAESLDPNWGGGGIGGGGGGFNPYDFSPSEALLYYLEIKGGTGFSTQQLSYLQNNPLVADSLKYYFLNDENSGSPSLLHWSVNFFIQNPNTSWTEFQNWFIDSNGTPNLTFDNSVNTNNSFVFTSLAEFKNALQSKNNSISTESSVIQDNGSEKIVSAKVKRTGFWNSGEEVLIKLKKINNTWTFDSVTSTEYGLTLGTWSFTQIAFTQNVQNQIIKVEVIGYENYNIFVEGIGTVYKDKVMIRVNISNNTGNISSIEFVDL